MHFREHPYDIRFLNGLSGDAAVYVQPPNQRTAFLFDCGQTDALSHKEILRIGRIFISHCHIDHFIGFDRIIRHAIPRFSSLTVYGPVGTAERVGHKLNGYLWNLLEDNQLVFRVHEILAEGGSPKAYLLRNQDGFRPQLSEEDSEEMQDGFRISTAVLDHGTDVAAYRVDYPIRYEMDFDRMAAAGLGPGVWIRQLKERLQADERDALVEIDGTLHRAGDLEKDLIARTDYYSVGYLTDFSFSQSNLDRIHETFAGVDALICEASFADEERARALSRKHLTTAQSAYIAAMVGARRYLPFHFSHLYRSNEDRMESEAQGFFSTFKAELPSSPSDLM